MSCFTSIASIIAFLYAPVKFEQIFMPFVCGPRCCCMINLLYTPLLISTPCKTLAKDYIYTCLYLVKDFYFLVCPPFIDIFKYKNKMNVEVINRSHNIFEDIFLILPILTFLTAANCYENDNC